MAEPLRPNPVKTLARENWVFVPTIADVTAPTVAEITAVSALDVTRILFADGEFSPTQNTNVVEQNKRFGDSVVRQAIGNTTYTGGEIRYQFDPQSAAASNGKKAFEKFGGTTNVSGYFVRRQGVARAVAFAADQFVDIFPVEIGPAMTTRTGDGENAETAAVSTVAVTDTPSINVEIVA
jgi:hypothetical protein